MSDSFTESVGIVVCMDALGTKGIWEQQENTKSYLEAWKTLYFNLDFISQRLNSYSNISFNELTPQKNHEYELDLATFSDTVILTLAILNKGDSNIAFNLMGEILIQLFLDAIKLGLLFRGIITFGKFYKLKTSTFVFAGMPSPPETSFPIRKLIVIGPAIDEAAEFYDKSKWIGISTSHSASVELDKFGPKSSAMDYFVKDDLRKYGVYEDGYALAWPRFDGKHPLNPTQENVVCYINDKYSQFKDQEEKAQKYQNTLAFYHGLQPRNSL
jgi:hypothetical protein